MAVRKEFKEVNVVILVKDRLIMPKSRLCPTPDGLTDVEVFPPENFNPVQVETWFELFDVLNDARVISYVDIPAFNILVISYAQIMRMDEEFSLGRLRALYGMLGKFGCLPSERRVAQIPGRAEHDQIDLFERNDADFEGL